MISQSNVISKEKFLTGGGNMGKLIRSFDWSSTSIGPIDTWPQSLRTAVSIVINSDFPMFIWWGQDDMINFYNDAYSEILGDKHPNALGQSGKDTWSEIWDDLKPFADRVFNTGKPVFMKDLPLYMYRFGRNEETYFTFSYSPIRDESGNIGGLYCACVETTNEVVVKRNLIESEERFRTMADDSEILIAVADENSNATYFNNAWSKLTGRPVQDLLKLGWADLIHEEDRQPFVDIYLKALSQKESFVGEFRVMSRDGTYRWLLAKVPARKRADGLFTGHISSCTDITDVKNAVLNQQRLKSVTDERNALIHINKTKDEFIGLASHQLRTPATAVKQYIGLVLHDFAGLITAEQRKYLEIAYDSNERQLNIVNDILKTAQLDSNRYALNQNEHDIIQVANSCITDLETLFKSRSQTVALVSSEKNLILRFDDIEIKLVLINLLENASKYSFENTEILVKFDVSASHVSLSVIDNGVGVDKADYKRIFDKFTRVDNKLSDTVTGTGLGLYWSKRIIRLHNGSIKVTSQPGEGSTFTIRLPLCKK